ncbi:L,D-transpeptidase family protein [Photobacterium halotolerans]|uniref:L,D-transpeptidase family protein n=1 Tax=Photobacterium halotolerans TaxID=265726 RepID=UPI00069911D4|nr:L,D-transpeptidase family protein [Photobacterium halotolerans]
MLNVKSGKVTRQAMDIAVSGIVKGITGLAIAVLMSASSLAAEEGVIRLVPAQSSIVSATLTAPQLGRHGLETVSILSSRRLCPGQTDQLCFPAALQNLYASHDFMPLWRDPALVEELLLQVTALAETHKVPGLLQRVQELQQLSQRDDQRGLDLLATDTLMAYQSVINQMINDPSTLYRPASFTLQDQQLTVTPRITVPLTLTALQQLRPAGNHFDRLVAEMRRLEQAQPHGVYLSGRPAIKFGAEIPNGDKLARMLNTYGDLSDQDFANVMKTDQVTGGSAAPQFMNTGVLHQAIRQFQHRHGLKDDGVIGPETAQNMARSYEQVAQLLALNLQRNRVLQRHGAGEVLQVNIPEFMLRIIDDENVVFESKVIVGRSSRPTYLFSSAINHMVVNPTWNVPETIKEEDVIPSMRRSPDYLARHNMRMVSRWSDDQSIDPAQIDWSTVSASNFPYEFQQRPGPDNALGQVKFMMPNDFSIYLHDTPAKRLFNKSKRNFSSGCVRVEKAHDLAYYLLERQRAGQSATYDNLLRKRNPATINLRKTLAVDFIYRTAWLDEQGKLQVRDDIYGYDDDSTVPQEHDYIAMMNYR